VSDFPRQSVVLCAPGFPSSRDDSDKPFLLNHALALVSAGFNVTVICPSIPGSARRQIVEGIEVVRTRYAPRRFETLAATGSMYREARGVRSLLVVPMIIALILSAVRESRKNNTIALHGHWWVPGGLVAVLASFFTRTQSVVHLHGSDSVIANSFIMRWLARRVMRSATHCLAVSEPLAIWGKNISSREVTVCPMPVSVVSSARPSVAPVEGPILGVGRLVHEKGFDVLIEALSMLDKDRRPVLVLIGAGPEHESLLLQANSLEVDLQLLGPLPPKAVAEWYTKASLVVVPSRREGFGLVAAEAAASARAVIGTRVGGIPKIINDGISGLLIEPNSVRGLKAALEQIDIEWGLAGPERIQNLGTEFHSDFLRKLYQREA
jgi:glycosyltransferase involved in cell wall biosynthesis